jgi:hypothetical protein
MISHSSSEPAALGGLSTRRRVLLRTACFDDYEQIAAVQEANGLATKSREQWLHAWQPNPAWQQLRDWPIGWVIEDAGGRIVGSLDNVPCLYSLQGRVYVGAFGRGWAVDDSYRPYALQLVARQAQQPNVDLLITNTANSRTAAVLTTRGWEPVPVGTWDRSDIWVASYAGTLQRCLDTKFPKFVSAATAPLLSPKRRKNAARPAHRPLKNGRELQWCTQFDDRFDRLWADITARRPQVLLAARDSQTLQWHFHYGLEQNRIFVLTASAGSRLIAYAVFERRPVQSSQLERILLVDFQSLDDDRALVSDMISSALEHCRCEQIQIVENMGCWLEAKYPGFKRPRFRRALGSWGYVYHAPNPQLAATLRNPEIWYPTQYDADATL